MTINRLATGVPGLDQILGGGLPEFSFNLIVGPPGSGKTTLAHQMMFALATPERPALFFTVLGEPALKMLRYQQQFSFFNFKTFTESVRFVNLNDDVTTGNFEQVLARITQEVKDFSPGLVFVDSFRSVVVEAGRHPDSTIGVQQFFERLGNFLSGWQATAFLIGEYSSGSEPSPVFTVADGLLALDQRVYRNSMVRQLQVLKMRGQATSPGMHTLRINGAGIEVFPAAVVSDDSGVSSATGIPRSDARLALGVPR
ncbi:MAG: ATPase domain-containing protein, partial [Propionivibrio sp.]